MSVFTWHCVTFQKLVKSFFCTSVAVSPMHFQASAGISLLSLLFIFPLLVCCTSHVTASTVINLFFLSFQYAYLYWCVLLQMDLFSNFACVTSSCAVCLFLSKLADHCLRITYHTCRKMKEKKLHSIKILSSFNFRHKTKIFFR